MTRCPAPGCLVVFSWNGGACPECGVAMRPRALPLLEELDRAHLKRRGRSAAGAPEGPAGRPPPFAAALEDVRSLWNVGSMFRTADGAGFSELYLCGITGCPPDAALAKVSLGAEETVRWEHYRGVLEVLPALAAAGVTVVALEHEPGSVPLADVLARGDLKAPLCLVVGNEVEGLSPEARGTAALTCHLPMRGNKSSLNAAVAFGVAAYAIRERVEP